MSSYKSSTMPQRSSPFRRPASPASSPTYQNNRSSTPPSTARPTASPMTSPSKLKHSYTVSEEEEEEEEEEQSSIIVSTPTKTQSSATSSAFRTTTESPTSVRRLPQPPTSSRPLPVPQPTMSSSPNYTTSTAPSMNNYNNKPYSTNTLTSSDPLSKLPPQLLHTLRESFSVLDPNSTGTLTPSSVHETLQSLGLDTSTINTLFPPGFPQSLSLPQYLNQLANLLANLSPQQELLNALSAFDDDDSGQIDVAELKRALVETVPDQGERSLAERDVDRALDGFTGRRILGKNAVGMAGVRGMSGPNVKKSNGDVFRYQEFVGSLMGGPSIDGNGQAIKA